MKIFLDTLDLKLIKYYSDIGILSGVTTNPTFSKKFNMYDDKETIKKVRETLGSYVEEIHVEVLAQGAENIIKKAKAISKETQDMNLVFKLPFGLTSLQAAKVLTKEGYKTNIHLIYSVNQALLSTKSNTTYICPLLGRLEDIGINAIEQIKDMQKAFELNNEKTQIMVSSVRCPRHVIESYKIGVSAITVPPDILEKMFYHPLTRIGIAKFKEDLNLEY